MPHNLKSVEGVEIFAAGTWNGDTYSVEDLDTMVEAYAATSAKWKPPIKLGHAKNQKLLQADGMPAAGRIGKLYRRGEKLLADFINVPAMIFELIQKKAYEHVSSEVYWDIQIEGKVYHRMIAAVSMLGADMPAVTNLKEMLALYGLAEFDTIKSYATAPEGLILKSYAHDAAQEDHPMPKTEAEINLERDLKEKTAEADRVSTEAKNYSAQLATEKKAREDLEAEVKEYKAKQKTSDDLAAAAILKAAEAELDRDVEKLSGEKLVTPAMKPYVRELLAAEKKEYSVVAKTGATPEKLSKTDLVRKILKLHSAVAGTVNLEERSSADPADATQVDDKLEADDKTIEKYMHEHKCTYSQAARAVIRERASAS